MKIIKPLIFFCLILQAVSKPNILFIAVDDLRPDFGENRDPWAKTPNIDRLQSEGVYFENTYCQYPVCGPSRSSIMTGLLPDSSGIYGFENADSKVGHVTILPQLLKDNGYTTGRFGKVFNNPMDFREAWSELPPEKIPEGYSWRYHQYVLPENKEKCREILAPEGDASEGKNQAPKPPSVERANHPDEDYLDHKNATDAIDFIKRNKDEPFFCAIGFKKPHLPFAAPERCWSMYDDVEIPFATNPFVPSRTSDFMACNWGELRSYSDIPNDGPLSLEKEKQLIQGYYATVSFVDDQIGRLLSTLDDLGLRSNTIVVFWSDHSFHLGENGIWAKHVNWEFTNKVPMIISTPYMSTAGQRSKALVELLDLYPTLAELTGLMTPAHVDGQSIAALLKEPETSWVESALSQYRRGKLMSYSIRTHRYRYSEWQKIGSNPVEVAGRELYDLFRDPEGNVNLISGPEFESIIAEHKVLLQRSIDRKN